MKVLILCGGQGTRAYPYTRRMPKALLPVAGLPVIEQVMRIYASQGFSEFVLSGGYLMDHIVRYFEGIPDWDVTCVNSGDATDTADRIRACLDVLGESFHATYCDGLGDIDLEALLQSHLEHGCKATMTAYPLRSQYGILHADGNDMVTRFQEKPVLDDHWINAGFFVFQRDAFDGVTGTNLESDVLPEMAERRTLSVYRHRGFWRSMDTYKDRQELDRLWGPFLTEQGSTGLASGPLPQWLVEQYTATEGSLA